MGNHEYCTDCGESNFHWGEPCDPEKKAAQQAKDDARRERIIRAERAAKALVQSLSAKGIPAKLDPDYKFIVEISGMDLIDTEHEPVY